MSIVAIFFACFLLFGRSKYFPKYLGSISKQLKKNDLITRITAYLSFFCSIVLLGNQFGWATGMIIFVMMLMFAYGLIVILLPLNKSYAYIIAGLCILSVLLEKVLLHAS